MNTKSTFIIFSLILFILVYVAFYSSLGYDFVWDDIETVINNHHIKSLNVENLKWAFTTTLSGNYLPITWISYILDYNFWGLNSYGFRLTNVIIHGFNSILLMLLIYIFLSINNEKQLNKFYLLLSSFIGALIYSVHPLRVESVVWITERKDVLSAFFLLLSLIAYINHKYLRTPAMKHEIINPYYMASYCFFILSLLCKAWAITFPVVLVVLDMAMMSAEQLSVRTLIQYVKNKIPFFIISIIFAGIAIFGQDTAGAMVSWEELTLTDRLLQASYGFNMYLLHTLFPYDLSPLYLLGKTNFQDIKFYLHFLIFLSMFIFSFMIRNINRWPFYVLLIYLIVVSPVLGLSQSGAQIMADRYTYIALIPFSFVIACLIYSLLCFVERNKNDKQKILIITSLSFVLILVTGALLIKTKDQASIWKNEETLWSHAIEIDANNYKALNNRADYRVKNKLFENAIEDYSRALEIDENNAYALNGRGAAKIYLNDLSSAIIDFNHALSILPTYVNALLNRGVAYNNLGKTDLATNDFQLVLSYIPDHVKANLYLGIINLSSNQFEKAISFFNNIIQNDIHHFESIYYRGLSHLALQKREQAKNDFERIVSNVDESTILYRNAEQHLKLLNSIGL